MNSKVQHWLSCALVALALVGLAVIVRIWPLSELGGRLTYVTYYPAVMGAALYGGAIGGGIATLIVSLLVCFANPGGYNFMRDSADIVGLGTFLCNGVMISVIGEMLRRTRQRKSEALAEARRFRMALDQIPSYVYIKDRLHRYVYVNRKTLEIFGRTAAEVYGKVDATFFPASDAERLRSVNERVMELGEDIAEETVLAPMDSPPHVYWEVKSPIYANGESGEIVGLCGISTDITERKQREEALLESEARFRAMFDEAPIGMALVSPDGFFVQVNNALCRLLDYEQQALQQMTFQELTYPDDLETDLNLVAEVIAGTRHSYAMEKRYVRRHGELIQTLLSVSSVRNKEGELRYFISQIQDISEQKYLLKQLHEQASSDSLTGLFNRRYFFERGTQELARTVRYEKPLSLLMLDVDHFKSINDTRGHRAGDEVLRHLGRLLTASLRNIDLCGRLGGEEFAILLPETEETQALEIAERLRAEIAAAAVMPEDGPALFYTASIGVATLGLREANLDTLLSEADSGLYQAKRKGRNCVCLAER